MPTVVGVGRGPHGSTYPQMRVVAKLYDSNNALVSTTNITPNLDGSWSHNLTGNSAGEKYVVVENDGYGTATYHIVVPTSGGPYNILDLRTSSGAVTGSEITDGTITNADISPSAGIDVTKISGLGTAASKNTGTAAGTVATGDDSRFTNARTPTVHHTTHESGGTDAVSLAASQITGTALVASNNLSDVGAAATARQNLGAQRRLTFTASKTSNYTAVDGDFVLCNATGGGFTVTLPAANVSGQVLAVEKTDSSANPATVSRAGSDTINGSATTITAALPGEVLIFTSNGSGSWWVTAGNKPLTSIDARYVNLSTVTTKGDIYAATGSGAIARVAVGTNGYALVADSSQSAGVAWAARSPDIQTFTGSGTWTKPAGAVTVSVILIGGGSGGASGRRGAAGTSRGGGGAGAGGAYSVVTLPASALGSTVSVTVGSGGSGGSAVTVNDTNGNPGGAGGNSIFGAFVQAFRGLASAGGTTAGGAGGLGLPGTGTGGNGGSGGTTAVGGPPTLNGGACGGCGGGGISSGDVPSNGGSRTSVGASWGPSVADGAFGVVDGAAAGNGASVPAGLPLVGSVPGGGAASITQAAGAGGNGALYGGGGSGGGASLNGFNSGAGGNGASGIVQVITYF